MKRTVNLSDGDSQSLLKLHDASQSQAPLTELEERKLSMMGMGDWGREDDRENDMDMSLSERHLSSASAMSRLSREMESSSSGSSGRTPTHDFLQKLMNSQEGMMWDGDSDKDDGSELFALGKARLLAFWIAYVHEGAPRAGAGGTKRWWPCSWV